MRRSLSIPLLLFALPLAWVLLAPQQTLLPEPPAPEDLPERIPDSYASNVRAREYDDSGKLLSETTAERLWRYSEGDVVEMSALTRVSHDPEGGWIASADEGTLHEPRDVLDLRGDVKLRYPDEGAVFHTEAMTINLDQESARSLAPVRIVQGDNTLRGDQLYINLNAQRATLTGDVESVYAPPR
jgi:LPS export ABC transporter protein LptC